MFSRTNWLSVPRWLRWLSFGLQRCVRCRRFFFGCFNRTHCSVQCIQARIDDGEVVPLSDMHGYDFARIEPDGTMISRGVVYRKVEQDATIGGFFVSERGDRNFVVDVPQRAILMHVPDTA